MRKSSRANCGLNPQLRIMTGADENLDKEASKHVWVFYKKHDKKPFELEYNSPRWPREYTTAMKMNMKPKEKVMLYFDHGYIKSSLCAIPLRSNKIEVERNVEARVAQAETSLTDVSFAPQ